MGWFAAGTDGAGDNKGVGIIRDGGPPEPLLCEGDSMVHPGVAGKLRLMSPEQHLEAQRVRYQKGC